MPAVKVFNIFGGKAETSAGQGKGTMQRFYRAFSIGSESNEQKANKVSVLAANLDRKTHKEEPQIALNSENVQKFLTKINVEGFDYKRDEKHDKRTYENVPFTNDKTENAEGGFEENKGYASIYENITIVGVKTEDKTHSSTTGDGSKLNKALESFDKILTEFATTPSLPPNVHSFTPPKLQKAKTCSIIESRCILKKKYSKSQIKPSTPKKASQTNPIDKTTSLWNLDDMQGRELSSPLTPLRSTQNDKTDRFATYKVSPKGSSTPRGALKSEELKKLDVKTRLLKKTLSNPPSTPVPVIAKPKVSTRRTERRTSDPKKKHTKQNQEPVKVIATVKYTENDKHTSRLQKAKSVWEISETDSPNRTLERTRSTTSISGSPSKIPVVRSQMSQSKFSSTRALFSPTPVDLGNVDQPRECTPKRKFDTPSKKPFDKPEPNRVKSKSQLNMKADLKRPDKTKKEDKAASSPKSSTRDYTNEINAVRAKLQQRKNTKRDITVAADPRREAEQMNCTSPVKSIVKKLELKTGLDTKSEPTQFVNCKVIAPVHKEVCVANMTFHNHLSTLVGRQVKYVKSLDDSRQVKHEIKSEEKISDAHSDCSDDSGHVSNDAANDHEQSFEESRIEKSASVDAVDSRSYPPEPPAFQDRARFSESVCKVVAPVKPVRRCGALGARIEVASGTGIGAKVDEQIFFRPGIVAGLDARRDAALARVLVSLQARARGLLARRRARKLRTQHTAARCIQRNVRAFLAVRDWPWWRLLVRVTPLLAVHRTEERLKLSTEETEALRLRVEKLDHERNYYKAESEKLENKLSECNADLAEERAAAGLSAERADAEAAERLRLERDNRDLNTNNQRLQQASERLELELLHWRSADAGGATSDEEGSDGGGERYKRRYERVARELQLTKAQLRRQHEDDLEQLVSVKKQLEKKLADAYEEVDEQRQVAAQWKRKVQKLTNDMADLRSLLDEQTCRNNLLEKRQRKFDSEQHALQDELKREKSARERLSREKDTATAEKYAAEQTLSEVRLELELKEERLASLAREAEEARGGGGEGELALLRRARTDLERRLRDQEEELDELAGQIQLLESSKLRLEMLLEQQRKEARLEAASRDDEMEETRANASKKVKMLESQLETEHAERTLLLRERHELERRLSSLEEVARTEQQEQQQLLQRLKRDLKRYRALLRDAQTMLEQKEKDSGGKAQIRQLKNQVEDLELAVRAATKARQSAEAEAAEATAALEESSRARQEAAERAAAAGRDAAAVRAQLDDAEEEAAEVLKKYRSSTTALCTAQAAAREASARAEASAEEARALRDKLAECTQRLAAAEAGHGQDAAEAERRLELRTKELESNVELEQTARARLEGQLARLRDLHDKLAGELGAARQREQHALDDARKLGRQLREVREEHTALTARVEEAQRARSTAEAAATTAAAEAAAARDEARLAARRANALQEAIAGDLSSPNDSRDTDSENDSYSSDESIGTFLANHKLSPSAPSRGSLHLDSQRSQGSEGRQSRSSAGSAKQLSPTKDSYA